MTIPQLTYRHLTHRLSIAGHYDDGTFDQVLELIAAKKLRSAELHTHTIHAAEKRETALRAIADARRSTTTQEDDHGARLG